MFNLLRFTFRTSLSNKNTIKCLANPNYLLLRAFADTALSQHLKAPIDPETKEPSTAWDYSIELTAFRHRFNVSVSDIKVFQRALTHKSYLIDHPEVADRECNDRYAILGQTIMYQYVMEYIFTKYPKLPAIGLRDVFNYLVDIQELTKVGNHLGIHELLLISLPKNEAIERNGCLGEALLAIIGSVYVDQGPQYARQLVHEFILFNLKKIDVYDIIKLEHPIEMLTEVLKIENKDPPNDELLWESGRDSDRPSFCVTVSSGDQKLSEGFGQSIDRARHNAYETALIQLFYKELRNVKLPSDLVDYNITYKLEPSL